jgi:hypothetical protein
MGPQILRKYKEVSTHISVAFGPHLNLPVGLIGIIQYASKNVNAYYGLAVDQKLE